VAAAASALATYASPEALPALKEACKSLLKRKHGRASTVLEAISTILDQAGEETKTVKVQLISYKTGDGAFNVLTNLTLWPDDLPQQQRVIAEGDELMRHLTIETDEVNFLMLNNYNGTALPPSVKLNNRQIHLVQIQD
jgi:hypothetical protein